jgi:hypothetical protein
MNPIIKTTALRSFKGSRFRYVIEFKPYNVDYLAPNHTNYAS